MVIMELYLVMYWILTGKMQVASKIHIGQNGMEPHIRQELLIFTRLNIYRNDDKKDSAIHSRYYNGFLL